jgi:hypothetical protein
MKRILKFSIVLIVVAAGNLLLNKCKAQDNFSFQCSPRFNAASAFYSSNGNFGVEFTKWASDAKYSWGFSMEMIRTSETYYNPFTQKDTSRSYYTAAAHLHTMYRINRYIHPILSVGMRELNAIEAFAGIRGVIPMGSMAFWVEPSYGTMGARVRLAFSVALIPRSKSPL